MGKIMPVAVFGLKNKFITMAFFLKDIQKIDEFKFYIPRDMKFSIVNGEYYEKNVIFWLEKIAASLKTPVFYDIGANFGYYSIKLSKSCADVYSFEPVTKTLKVLNENIKRNGIKNIATFKVGLSNLNEDKEINIYNSSGNNSIFKRNVPEGHTLKLIDRELINLQTLDAFVEKNNLFLPNIIKIDVEGAEINVLKGSQETIRKSQPIILVEYSESTSLDAGYDREEIIKEINKLGSYKIFGLAEDVENNELIEIADFKENKIANILAVPDNFNF